MNNILLKGTIFREGYEYIAKDIKDKQILKSDCMIDCKVQERICEKTNARHCIYMNYSSRD